MTSLEKTRLRIREMFKQANIVPTSEAYQEHTYVLRKLWPVLVDRITDAELDAFYLEAHYRSLVL